MFRILSCYMALFEIIFCDESVIPRGHLKPLGSWKDPIGMIDSIDDIISSKEFFEIVKENNFISRPILFKNALKDSYIVNNWKTDEFLRENYGDMEVMVEYNKKETRKNGNFETNLDGFLNEYNNSDIYLVTDIMHEKMLMDIKFLPFFKCGGLTNYLGTRNMWMSSGKSQSVVHSDNVYNINCIIDGQKKWIFFNSTYEHQFETYPNNDELNGFGFMDAGLDNFTYKENNEKEESFYYGKWFNIDVNAVDLIKYPGWKNIDWYYTDTNVGDCIFVPSGWYHQVSANQNTRTINIHMWFGLSDKSKMENNEDFDKCYDEFDNNDFSFVDCDWLGDIIMDIGVSGEPFFENDPYFDEIPITLCGNHREMYYQDYADDEMYEYHEDIPEREEL